MMNFKKIKNGTVSSPLGFLADGIFAGLKSPGPDKLDLGLLISETECEWAATYTSNQVKSASIDYCREIESKIQGIIVNSGSANCCVGEQGLLDARKMASMTKEYTNSKFPFLVSSTGVIGAEIPIGLVEKNISKFEATDAGGEKFSRAIITTDSKTKNIAISVKTDDGVFSVGGVAKGSGMIHPMMGTMLSYITTDAKVGSDILTRILRDSVDQSFNQVDVDGDSSTNDTVVLMANGKSGVEISSQLNTNIFSEAILYVSKFLAKLVAEDGEGISHLITVEVTGGLDDIQARNTAHSVVSSSLVKTAIYGKDPNWGRIMMAVGNTKSKIERDKIKMSINGIQIVEEGKSISFHYQSVISALNHFEVEINIDLGLGNGRGIAWGSDLTEEYVVFNSAYTT